MADNISKMRKLARLLLLISAMVYGTMPMTLRQVEAAPVSSAVEQMAEMSDCPHITPSFSTEVPRSDGGQNPTGHASWHHCSACMTLAADLSIKTAGAPARPAEAGSPLRVLKADEPLPAERPPRA